MILREMEFFTISRKILLRLNPAVLEGSPERRKGMVAQCKANHEVINAALG